MTERTLDIVGLTKDPGEAPQHAVQYTVRHRGNVEPLNGDQSWVRNGELLAHLGTGLTVVRDVTITYGPWRRAGAPDQRALVFWHGSTEYCGRGWTWCWEVRGRIIDHAHRLPPARQSWADTYAEAMAAVRATLPAEPGQPPPTEQP